MSMSRIEVMGMIISSPDFPKLLRVLEEAQERLTPNSGREAPREMFQAVVASCSSNSRNSQEGRCSHDPPMRIMHHEGDPLPA